MRDEDVLREVNRYCGDGMLLLKKVCFPIIAQFGGIAESEYEDFWSAANETVWSAAVRFDDTIHDSFDNYLKGCLHNRFKTLMTKKNRKKRIPVNHCVSIDTRINEDSEKTYADLLDSGYRIDDDIKELNDDNDGLDEFLNGLSKKQLQIVNLIMFGYDKDEIKQKLKMSDKRFETCVSRMRTFENRILLGGRYSKNI